MSDQEDLNEFNEPSASNSRGLSAEGKKKLNNAKIALFVVGGLTIVVNLIMVNTMPEYKGLPFLWKYADVGFWFIFIGLGFLVNKYPYYSILAGLIAYIVINVLSAVIDPTSIAKGVIMKVIIVMTLVKGLKEAKDVKEEIDRGDLLDQGLSDL